jgi:phosphoribosylaminoimidazolecarboxamide formyltransferase/IMP cyclohydrolase
MRQLAEAGIEPIDMVVVNLYPFQKTIARPGCTFAEAIEMIDVGGPCMLRAAAKNHKHVLVANRPEAYAELLALLRRWDEPGVREACHRKGAVDAFSATAGYDAAIARWLTADEDGRFSAIDMLPLARVDRPRYGENPHQVAQVLRRLDDVGAADGSGLLNESGSPVAMSYNNHVDADAAFELCRELSLARGSDGLDASHACVFIKHTNACGAGIGKDPIQAYARAYLGDPNAAMGGILACDFRVTADFAEAVMNSLGRWGKVAGAGAFFVEVWLAPAFDGKAVEIIRTAKSWGERVRIQVRDVAAARNPKAVQYKSIDGGFLAQAPDDLGLNEAEWNVVTRRRPSERELLDLRLAWLVCKHTKSNAITVCKDGMLLGNGAGQMSRVMSCRLATWLAKENGHEASLAGSVAASDAFFPFRDGPDLLADAGVTAIIQPGGSKRDDETIAACDERGLAMIVTGTRHFKH